MIVKEKNKHYLDEKQKKLAEDNFALVWSFMGRQIRQHELHGSELDEASGYVIWYYCLACKSFDPSINVKFSTYAYKSFLSGLKRYKDLRSINDRYLKIGIGIKLEDNYIEENYKKIESRALDCSHLSNIKINLTNIKNLMHEANLTYMEYEFIHFRYIDNYTYKEIGSMLGFSRDRIRQICANAIAKITEVAKDKDYKMEDFIK